MRTLIDKLRLRSLIIKEKLANYMQPILGYNFLERQREKSMRPSPREKVTYNIITIPGLDEYVMNHSNK